MTRVVDLCAAPGSWSQVLSRVLIDGEKFGRAAWEDEALKARQELLTLFAPKTTNFASCRISDNIAQKNKQTSKLRPRTDVKIVAIDLQPMSPLRGIITLRADITHPSTLPLLLNALDPTSDQESFSQHMSNPVDLVLSDGAPDVTGLHDLDIYIQSQLLFAALNLALCVLRPGGKFVAKIFRGRNVDLLFAQLKVFFERVIFAKPRSSRASSIEAFAVCLNFSPPSDFRASLEEPLGVGNKLAKMVASRKIHEPVVSSILLQNPMTSAWSTSQFTSFSLKKNEHEAVQLFSQEHQIGEFQDGRWIAPFLACGDLSSYDADASYNLPEDHVTLNPVQPPTAPPYKRALEIRKAAGGAYGKTSNGQNLNIDF